MINSISKNYLKFADQFYKVIQFICKILFVIMIFSVSYAVFGRFVLKDTPRWCEEIGIICMVWLGFLSSTLAIKDGSHIRMTIIENIFPKKICQFLHLCTYLVLLVLNIVWLKYGAQVIELTVRTKMPATQLPQALLYGSVALAGGIGIIMTLARIAKGEW